MRCSGTRRNSTGQSYTLAEKASWFYRYVALHHLFPSASACSFPSPAEKRHLLVTVSIPRVGDRCVHDRHHAILLPRRYRGQPRGCQTAIRAIHTLGRRGHTRCSRRNADHCGHGRTSMTLRIGPAMCEEWFGCLDVFILHCSCISAWICGIVPDTSRASRITKSCHSIYVFTCTLSMHRQYDCTL